jgi:hypothetical protein
MRWFLSFSKSGFQYCAGKDRKFICSQQCRYNNIDQAMDYLLQSREGFWAVPNILVINFSGFSDFCVDDMLMIRPNYLIRRGEALLLIHCLLPFPCKKCFTRLWRGFAPALQD